jgi:hypothetical protein
MLSRNVVPLPDFFRCARSSRLVIDVCSSLMLPDSTWSSEHPVKLADARVMKEYK